MAINVISYNVFKICAYIFVKSKMTSRLIVKNLPKAITEDKLKETFGQKGIITDVQLKFTKEGKFRHFAFIGFQNEEQAKDAQDYFDNTFLNSLRIKVEQCSELGDENKPKSWSKYAPDSTAYKKEHGTLKSEEVLTKNDEPKTKKKSKLKPEIKEKLKQHLNDPLFAEFLEAHGQDKILKVIKEEDKVDESITQEKTDGEPLKKIANADISDFEYLKIKSGIKLAEISKSSENKTEYHTIVIRGLPYKIKKPMLKEFFKPLKLDSIRLPPKIKGVAYIGFKNKRDAEQCLIKNKSFLNGKRVLLYPMKNETNKLEENNHSGRNPDWQKQSDSLLHEESIAESGRIFIRNLPFITTEDELQKLFEKYGPVTEVIIPVDKISRQVKGYGLITYLMPEHAVKAYTELDGTIFHGRMMHLLPGKAKVNLEDETINEGSSYKKKKMVKLKSEAGLSHNWNSLFLGQNAVADIITKTYNTTKENVLTGDSAAVRLALGESQIVSDTKTYLEKHGVKLDIFNQTIINRSKNIILVKNLPANTTELEIKDIFSKYGLVNRVILPPSGVTGLIEFVQNSEAKTAFRQLAYSKFKHLPLYLEWAPDKVLSYIPEKINEETQLNTKKKEPEDDTDEPESDTTIFIKNINFNTTEENITKHFESCGKIANVTIARRKDPNHPGQLLSMGYGFIQFYKQKSLNEALKIKQFSMLDDHSIELKRSNRTLQSTTVVDRKQGKSYEESTKILVRNIPFQASIQEVIELFKTFGELKGLRMPKKMVGTGTHRGFAFVEYNSKIEAKAAMDSMCQSTHLYGRRLVLEWAQAGENIDEMRKRTANQYETLGGMKKQCKGVADIEIEENENKEL